MEHARLSASADVKNTRLRVHPKAKNCNTANARTQLQQKKTTAAAATAAIKSTKRKVKAPLLRSELVDVVAHFLSSQTTQPIVKVTVRCMKTIIHTISHWMVRDARMCRLFATNKSAAMYSDRCPAHSTGQHAMYMCHIRGDCVTRHP